MMGRFNIKDYVEVKDRIPLFFERHPEGRIVTELERLDPPLVVVKATLYRDHEPTTPALATGLAYEIEGEGHVNATSYVENCETSAIGRALANAGFAGPDGAPRPSKEEMEKVDRMTRSQVVDWLDKAAEGQHVTPAEAERIEKAVGDPDTALKDLQRARDTLKKWCETKRQPPKEEKEKVPA